MNKVIITLGVTALLSTSCAELQQVANQVITTNSNVMTGTDNASGLKEALLVGTANTVLRLNKQDGFFANQALKILLPEEAQPILKNIRLVPGGDKLVNDVVLRLNRAAEDAASEAKPVFVSAIRNMTIADATNILFGANDAATNYLRKNTYSQLSSAFQPKIDASLGKKLVGNISTTDSWRSLATAYNSVANTLVGKAANMKPVSVNLTQYVTDRALSGIFISLASEEKQIRENPAARVNTILKKVFGQLDARK